MKLQVKQLDEATSNTIAVALEHYAEYLWNAYGTRADMCLELSVMFRHSIPLLVSEAYSEKGGNHGL